MKDNYETKLPYSSFHCSCDVYTANLSPYPSLFFSLSCWFSDSMDSKRAFSLTTQVPLASVTFLCIMAILL